MSKNLSANSKSAPDLSYSLPLVWRLLFVCQHTNILHFAHANFVCEVIAEILTFRSKGAIRVLGLAEK